MAVLIPKIFVKYMIYILFIYSIVTIFYLLGGFDWGSTVDRHVRLDSMPKTSRLSSYDDSVAPGEIAFAPKTEGTDYELDFIY